MQPVGDTLIEKLLIADEGYRRYPYTDTLGYLTIGIGRCIDQRKGAGISPEEALFMLRRDIAERESDLVSYLPWYAGLDPVRKAVFLSMSFQLGIQGLLLFKTTLTFAERGDWESAAASMMRSKWATQTPLRVSRLSRALVSGDVGDLEID